MIVEQPQGNKLTGFFRGKVVKHLPHGRCKVWIPGVYPDEFKAAWQKLPPAEQISPIFGGCNDGNGTFSYPNIGSTVVCGFWNGDQNLPFFFGSVLGSPNAFGQYEIVKMQAEDVSPRHMVTAGKTQVELFESGVISSVVSNPIRTQSLVDFAPEMSAQHVVQRPECESIISDEIASSECQIVQDVNSKHGDISSSTRFYDFDSQLCTVFLSAENILSVTSYDWDVSASTFIDQSNFGAVCDAQVSSAHKREAFSITKAQTKENETSAYQITCDTSSRASQDNAAGATSYGNISSYALNEQYNYANGNTNVLINRIYSESDDGESYDEIGVNGSTARGSTWTKSVLSTYVNTQTTQSMIHNETNSLDNTESFDGNSFSARSLSSRDYDFKNVTAETQQIDKRAVQHEMSLAEGFAVRSQYDDDETYVSKGLPIQTVINNENDVGSDTTASGSAVRMFSKYYKRRVQSGIESITHIECLDRLDSAAGTLTIKISDAKGGSGCEMVMDAAGNINVNASTSINFVAPTVTFNGDTFTSDFLSITETGSTVNITGDSGDCKISNVSLLNHVHTEMQSGDIVQPGSVKTQTATASN